MSISGGKNRSGPTRATNARASEIYRTAQRAGDAPIPGGVTGAGGYYDAARGAGQLGLDALTGVPGAGDRFMNPYQQQVIDRLNEQFAVQNQMTSQGVNDAATRAGAFGGSRHGIAEGTALAENARNQGLQVAGLLNQGFDNSMNRAAQAAGLGFDAAGAGATLGMTAGNQELWRLMQLQRGFTPLQAGRGFNLGFTQRGP